MKKIILFFVFFSVFSFSALAAENPSGLPIPRYVALKSDNVNARSGPGVNYPIKWVYTKQYLPVEVTAEFGNWRKIQDMSGEGGWVLQSLLTGKRSVITTKEATVYNSYKGDRAVLRLGRDVQVALKTCEHDQCKIEYEATQGWLDRSAIWGVYEKESFD